MLMMNLLPFQEKRTLRWEEWRRLVRFFGVLAVGVLAVGIFLLIPSFLPLYGEERQLARSLAVEEEAFRALDVQQTVQNMRSLGVFLASARHYLADPPSVSAVVEGVFGAAGPGVVLSEISVTRDRTVALAGTARTRRDLLRFEEALKSSRLFRSISSPFSNILREENVSFTVRAELIPR